MNVKPKSITIGLKNARARINAGQMPHQSLKGWALSGVRAPTRASQEAWAAKLIASPQLPAVASCRADVDEVEEQLA